MKKSPIFIHIPKTGGTTINCAMHGTDWQTQPDYHYRHIIYQTKRSNSADIFRAENQAEYSAQKIFMLLRDPADRLLSEYYFIRDRKEFMKLFRNKPRNFTDYIKNRQTQNYITGFLVGKQMFDLQYTKQEDLDSVLAAIDKLPITVGLFEYFEESMSYFEKEIGIKWPKKIEAKRITLNKPKETILTLEVRALIKENNALDYALYEYCLNIFKENAADKLNTKVSFEKDKYNYVVKYNQRFALIELYLKNKSFLKTQSKFFQNLSVYIQQSLGLNDGRSITSTWNTSFVNSIEPYIKDKETQVAFRETLEQEKEPLDITQDLATLLDQFLLRKGRILLTQRIAFDESNITKVAHDKPKKGFAQKLKGFFGK